MATPISQAKAEEMVGDLVETFDTTISDLHLLRPTITKDNPFPPKIEANLTSLNVEVESFFRDCLFEKKLIEETKKDAVSLSNILGELRPLVEKVTKETPWQLSNAIRRLETIFVWCEI